MSNFNPGSVASRFVSQAELTEAQKKREADMKAAYARMGQEPPPQQEEQEYDPRSLYERLQAQKDAKQEKMDEMFSLGNQFRGLDEGESEFLAEVQAERREEELRKKREEENELEEFRKAALAREASPPNPVALLSASKPAPAASPPARTAPSASAVPSPAASASKPKGKRKREGLLGVVRKKPETAKAAPQSASPATPSASAKASEATSSSADKVETASTSAPEEDTGKRRKTDAA